MQPKLQIEDVLNEISQTQQIKRILARSKRIKQSSKAGPWENSEWMPQDSPQHITQKKPVKPPRMSVKSKAIVNSHLKDAYVLPKVRRHPSTSILEKRRSRSDTKPESKNHECSQINEQKQQEIEFKVPQSLEKHAKLHPVLIRLSLNDSKRSGASVNYGSISANGSVEMMQKLKRKVNNLSKLKKLQQDYSSDKIIKVGIKKRQSSFINHLFRTKQIKQQIPQDIVQWTELAQENTNNNLFNYKSENRYT